MLGLRLLRARWLAGAAAEETGTADGGALVPEGCSGMLSGVPVRHGRDWNWKSPPGAGASAGAGTPAADGVVTRGTLGAASMSMASCVPASATVSCSSSAGGCTTCATLVHGAAAGVLFLGVGALGGRLVCRVLRLGAVPGLMLDADGGS